MAGDQRLAFMEVNFRQDLRVTVQALGWRSTWEDKRRYLPLQGLPFGIRPSPTRRFPRCLASTICR